MNRITYVSIAVCVSLFSTSGLTGEWHAERLRGVVLMMVDGDWAPIERGMVVQDDRVIRTGANGQVTFRSGDQLIELRRDTQIQISAAEDRDHTWVFHAGGDLIADVDARDVEHFAVRTHHLVAVVKGTRFSVSANEDGAGVIVERGTVAINESERGLSVSINAGQRASGGNGRLQVGGEGELPVVVDGSGRALPVAETRIDPIPSRDVRPPDAASAPSFAPGNWGNTPAAENRNANSNAGAIGNAPDHSNAGGNGGGNGNGNAGGNANSGSNSGGSGSGGSPSSNAGGGNGNNGSGAGGNGSGSRSSNSAGGNGIGNAGGNGRNDN